jgi:hypothetical protein
MAGATKLMKRTVIKFRTTGRIPLTNHSFSGAGRGCGMVRGSFLTSGRKEMKKRKKESSKRVPTRYFMPSMFSGAHGGEILGALQVGAFVGPGPKLSSQQPRGLNVLLNTLL